MKAASLLSSAVLVSVRMACLRQVLANPLSECRSVTVEIIGDADGSYIYSALQSNVSQGRPVFFSDANSEAPYLALVGKDVALPSSDNTTVGAANCTNVWALMTALESSVETSSSVYSDNCHALHPADITGPWYTYSLTDAEGSSPEEDSSKQVLIDCAEEDEASSLAADDCATAYSYTVWTGSYTSLSCYTVWDSNVGLELTVTPVQGELVSLLISTDALTCALAQDFEDMDYIEGYSRPIASDEEFTVSVSIDDEAIYAEAYQSVCLIVYCDSVESGYVCDGSVVGGWDFDGDDKAAKTFWTWVGCIIGAIVLSIIICAYFCCCRKRTVILDKGTVVPMQQQQLIAQTPQLSPQQQPQPGMVYPQQQPQQGMVYPQPQPQPGVVYPQQQPQPGMAYTQQG